VFAVDSQRALDLIRQANRILITTHVSPDGDAIGSLLAMGLLVRQLGKEHITLALDDGVPAKFDFLPGAAQVVRAVDGPYDLILILDCSDDRRGGQVLRDARREGVPVINIDHHITNTSFATVNLVRLDAAATTQVIFWLAQAWELDVDQPVALCLLTGLVTDTLCFRTANVTPKVMEDAAALMEAGADLSMVTRQTVNRKSYDAIRYWGEMLDTVNLEERIIWAIASPAMRQRAGYESNGDASLVTFLATAWEADIAFTLAETDNGEVEVSLRAKPGFDVSGVALELGGGGHPAAAGATINGPLAEAKDRVLARVKRSRRDQIREPGDGA
jgi:bifunctional oligoribonuclease and PAP phosphatase NrnA